MANNPAKMTDDALPPWLEWLDPTADVGMRVRARTLRELFARAAWGLFFLLTDVRNVRPVLRHDLRLSADDPAALLVRWLSELNFRHQTDHVVYCGFTVHRVSRTSLWTTAQGELLRPDLPVHTEIKAVTYHGLCLEREGRIWKAEVIFDV